ncbi:unnamed protein product, partial [Owenia fusiformis]
YEDDLDSVTSWIDETENRLKMEAELKIDLLDTAGQLSKAEAEHSLIEENKRSVDQLLERSNIVLQHHAEPKVSTTVVEQSTRYQALLAASKRTKSRFSQFQKD